MQKRAVCIKKASQSYGVPNTSLHKANEKQALSEDAQESFRLCGCSHRIQHSCRIHTNWDCSRKLRCCVSKMDRDDIQCYWNDALVDHLKKTRQASATNIDKWYGRQENALPLLLSRVLLWLIWSILTMMPWQMGTRAA